MDKKEGEDKEEELSIKMPNLLKKLSPEHIFLIIFAASLLVFISVYEGGHIIHGSPYQLVAGDAFTFNVFSELPLDVNNYSLLPPYLAAGIADAANFFPPTPGIIVAELSLLSGAQTYDVLLHFNILLIILMAMGVYLALRLVNKNLAILGIVLVLISWKYPFSYVINWGAHLSVVNLFFGIGTLLAFLFLKERFMFVVFGIINASAFIAHGREFLTFNIAVALIFLFKLLLNKFDFKKIDWPLLKNYLLSIIVTTVLLFRYLPVLRQFGGANLGQQTQGEFFKYCPLDASSYHYVSFQTTGIFKWIIIIGMVFAVYLVLKKIKMETLLSYIIMFSLTYVLSSYFCIIGNKTTQIRHFYPVFLIPLLAIGAYNLIMLFKNQIGEKHVTTVSIFVAIIFIILAFVQHFPQQSPEYASSNPYTWDGIKWIGANTPENAKILVLYGDNFGQESMFWSLKRTWEKIIDEKYLQKVQEGRITPVYDISIKILGNHLKRNSLFNLTLNRYTAPDGSDLKVSEKSLCGFDYIFCNKGSQNQIIHAYTITLLNELINEGKFVPVYQNDLMIILKNTDVNGKCFKEKVISYESK